MGHLFHSYVSHLPGIPTSQALRRKERSRALAALHPLGLGDATKRSRQGHCLIRHRTECRKYLGIPGGWEKWAIGAKKPWFILIGLFFPDVCTVYQTWGATFIKIKTTFLKVNGSSWRGGKMNEQHTHTHTHTRQERIFEKTRQELSPVTYKPA